MRPSEATILLTKISAFDNREVTEPAARAFAEALPDVTLADALQVIPGFFRSTSADVRSWLAPGDIIFRVRDLYRQRAAEVGQQAGEAAIAGKSEDDDEVPPFGGLDMIKDRAARLARKEWLAANPMPGEDVAAAERKMHERTDRYQRTGDGSGARFLTVPPATPTAESWAALLAAANEPETDA